MDLVNDFVLKLKAIIWRWLYIWGPTAYGL